MFDVPVPSWEPQKVSKQRKVDMTYQGMVLPPISVFILLFVVGTVFGAVVGYQLVPRDFMTYSYIKYLAIEAASNRAMGKSGTSEATAALSSAPAEVWSSPVSSGVTLFLWALPWLGPAMAQRGMRRLRA